MSDNFHSNFKRKKPQRDNLSQLYVAKINLFLHQLRQCSTNAGASGNSASSASKVSVANSRNQQEIMEKLIEFLQKIAENTGNSLMKPVTSCTQNCNDDNLENSITNQADGISSPSLILGQQVCSNIVVGVIESFINPQIYRFIQNNSDKSYVLAQHSNTGSSTTQQPGTSFARVGVKGSFLSSLPSAGSNISSHVIASFRNGVSKLLLNLIKVIHINIPRGSSAASSSVNPACQVTKTTAGMSDFVAGTPFLYKNGGTLHFIIDHILSVLSSEILVNLQSPGNILNMSATSVGISERGEYKSSHVRGEPLIPVGIGVDYAHILTYLLSFQAYQLVLTKEEMNRVCSTLFTLLSVINPLNVKNLTSVTAGNSIFNNNNNNKRIGFNTDENSTSTSSATNEHENYFFVIHCINDSLFKLWQNDIIAELTSYAHALAAVISCVNFFTMSVTSKEKGRSRTPGCTTSETGAMEFIDLPGSFSSFILHVLSIVATHHGMDVSVRIRCASDNNKTDMLGASFVNGGISDQIGGRSAIYYGIFDPVRLSASGMAGMNFLFNTDGVLQSTLISILVFVLQKTQYGDHCQRGSLSASELLKCIPIRNETQVSLASLLRNDIIPFFTVATSTMSSIYLILIKYVNLFLSIWFSLTMKRDQWRLTVILFIYNYLCLAFSHTFVELLSNALPRGEGTASGGWRSEDVTSIDGYLYLDQLFCEDETNQRKKNDAQMQERDKESCEDNVIYGRILQFPLNDNIVIDESNFRHYMFLHECLYPVIRSILDGGSRDDGQGKNGQQLQLPGASGSSVSFSSTHYDFSALISTRELYEIQYPAHYSVINSNTNTIIPEICLSSFIHSTSDLMASSLPSVSERCSEMNLKLVPPRMVINNREHIQVLYDLGAVMLFLVRKTSSSYLRYLFLKQRQKGGRGYEGRDEEVSEETDMNIANDNGKAIGSDDDNNDDENAEKDENDSSSFEEELSDEIKKQNNCCSYDMKGSILMRKEENKFNKKSKTWEFIKNTTISKLSHPSVLEVVIQRIRRLSGSSKPTTSSAEDFTAAQLNQHQLKHLQSARVFIHRQGQHDVPDYAVPHRYRYATLIWLHVLASPLSTIGFNSWELVRLLFQLVKTFVVNRRRSEQRTRIDEEVSGPFGGRGTAHREEWTSKKHALGVEKLLVNALCVVIARTPFITAECDDNEDEKSTEFFVEEKKNEHKIGITKTVNALLHYLWIVLLSSTVLNSESNVPSESHYRCMLTLMHALRIRQLFTMPVPSTFTLSKCPHFTCGFVEGGSCSTIDRNEVISVLRPYHPAVAQFLVVAASFTIYPISEKIVSHFYDVARCGIHYHNMERKKFLFSREKQFSMDSSTSTLGEHNFSRFIPLYSPYNVGLAPLVPFSVVFQYIMNGPGSNQSQLIPALIAVCNEQQNLLTAWEQQQIKLNNDSKNSKNNKVKKMNNNMLESFDGMAPKQFEGVPIAEILGGINQFSSSACSSQITSTKLVTSLISKEVNIPTNNDMSAFSNMFYYYQYGTACDGFQLNNRVLRDGNGQNPSSYENDNTGCSNDGFLFSSAFPSISGSCGDSSGSSFIYARLDPTIAPSDSKSIAQTVLTPLQLISWFINHLVSADGQGVCAPDMCGNSVGPAITVIDSYLNILYSINNKAEGEGVETIVEESITYGASLGSVGSSHYKLFFESILRFFSLKSLELFPKASSSSFLLDNNNYFESTILNAAPTSLLAGFLPNSITEVLLPLTVLSTGKDSNILTVDAMKHRHPYKRNNCGARVNVASYNYVKTASYGWQRWSRFFETLLGDRPFEKTSGIFTSNENDKSTINALFVRFTINAVSGAVVRPITSVTLESMASTYFAMYNAYDLLTSITGCPQYYPDFTTLASVVSSALVSLRTLLLWARSRLWEMNSSFCGFPKESGKGDSHHDMSSYRQRQDFYNLLRTGDQRLLYVTFLITQLVAKILGSSLSVTIEGFFSIAHYGVLSPRPSSLAALSEGGKRLPQIKERITLKQYLNSLCGILASLKLITNSTLEVPFGRNSGRDNTSLLNEWLSPSLLKLSFKRYSVLSTHQESLSVISRWVQTTLLEILSLQSTAPCFLYRLFHHSEQLNTTSGVSNSLLSKQAFGKVSSPLSLSVLTTENSTSIAAQSNNACAFIVGIAGCNYNSAAGMNALASTAISQPLGWGRASIYGWTRGDMIDESATGDTLNSIDSNEGQGSSLIEPLLKCVYDCCDIISALYTVSYGIAVANTCVKRENTGVEEVISDTTLSATKKVKHLTTYTDTSLVLNKTIIDLENEDSDNMDEKDIDESQQQSGIGTIKNKNELNNCNSMLKINIPLVNEIYLVYEINALMQDADFIHDTSYKKNGADQESVPLTMVVNSINLTHPPLLILMVLQPISKMLLQFHGFDNYNMNDGDDNLRKDKSAHDNWIQNDLICTRNTNHVQQHCFARNDYNTYKLVYPYEIVMCMVHSVIKYNFLATHLGSLITVINYFAESWCYYNNKGNSFNSLFFMKWAVAEIIEVIHQYDISNNHVAEVRDAIFACATSHPSKSGPISLRDITESKREHELSEMFSILSLDGSKAATTSPQSVVSSHYTRYLLQLSLSGNNSGTGVITARTPAELASSGSLLINDFVRVLMVKIAEQFVSRCDGLSWAVPMGKLLFAHITNSSSTFPFSFLPSQITGRSSGGGRGDMTNSHGKTIHYGYNFIIQRISASLTRTPLRVFKNKSVVLMDLMAQMNDCINDAIVMGGCQAVQRVSVALLALAEASRGEEGLISSHNFLGGGGSGVVNHSEVSVVSYLFELYIDPGFTQFRRFVRDALSYMNYQLEVEGTRDYFFDGVGNHFITPENLDHPWYTSLQVSRDGANTDKSFVNLRKIETLRLSVPFYAQIIAKHDIFLLYNWIFNLEYPLLEIPFDLFLVNKSILIDEDEKDKHGLSMYNTHNTYMETQILPIKNITAKNEIIKGKIETLLPFAIMLSQKIINKEVGGGEVGGSSFPTKFPGEKNGNMAALLTIEKVYGSTSENVILRLIKENFVVVISEILLFGAFIRENDVLASTEGYDSQRRFQLLRRLFVTAQLSIEFLRQQFRDAVFLHWCKRHRVSIILRILMSIVDERTGSSIQRGKSNGSSFSFPCHSKDIVALDDPPYFSTETAMRALERFAQLLDVDCISSIFLLSESEKRVSCGISDGSDDMATGEMISLEHQHDICDVFLALYGGIQLSLGMSESVVQCLMALKTREDDSEGQLRGSQVIANKIMECISDIWDFSHRQSNYSTVFQLFFVFNKIYHESGSDSASAFILMQKHAPERFINTFYIFITKIISRKLLCKSTLIFETLLRVFCAIIELTTSSNDNKDRGIKEKVILITLELLNYIWVTVLRSQESKGQCIEAGDKKNAQTDNKKLNKGCQVAVLNENHLHVIKVLTTALTMTRKGHKKEGKNDGIHKDMGISVFESLRQTLSFIRSTIRGSSSGGNEAKTTKRARDDYQPHSTVKKSENSEKTQPDVVLLPRATARLSLSVKDIFFLMLISPRYILDASLYDGHRRSSSSTCASAPPVYLLCVLYALINNSVIAEVIDKILFREASYENEIHLLTGMSNTQGAATRWESNYAFFLDVMDIMGDLMVDCQVIEGMPSEVVDCIKEYLLDIIAEERKKYQQNEWVANNNTFNSVNNIHQRHYPGDGSDSVFPSFLVSFTDCLLQMCRQLILIIGNGQRITPTDGSAIKIGSLAMDILRSFCMCFVRSKRLDVLLSVDMTSTAVYEARTLQALSSNPFTATVDTLRVNNVSSAVPNLSQLLTELQQAIIRKEGVTEAFSSMPGEYNSNYDLVSRRRTRGGNAAARQGKKESQTAALSRKIQTMTPGVVESDILTTDDLRPVLWDSCSASYHGRGGYLAITALSDDFLRYMKKPYTVNKNINSPHTASPGGGSAATDVPILLGDDLPNIDNVLIRSYLMIILNLHSIAAAEKSCNLPAIVIARQALADMLISSPVTNPLVYNNKDSKNKDESSMPSIPTDVLSKCLLLLKFTMKNQYEKLLLFRAKGSFLPSANVSNTTMMSESNENEGRSSASYNNFIVSAILGPVCSGVMLGDEGSSQKGRAEKEYSSRFFIEELLDESRGYSLKDALLDDGFWRASGVVSKDDDCAGHSGFGFSNESKGVESIKKIQKHKFAVMKQCFSLSEFLRILVVLMMKCLLQEKTNNKDTKFSMPRFPATLISILRPLLPVVLMSDELSEMLFPLLLLHFSMLPSNYVCSHNHDKKQDDFHNTIKDSVLLLSLNNPCTETEERDEKPYDIQFYRTILSARLEQLIRSAGGMSCSKSHDIASLSGAREENKRFLKIFLSSLNFVRAAKMTIVKLCSLLPQFCEGDSDDSHKRGKTAASLSSGSGGSLVVGSAQSPITLKSTLFGELTQCGRIIDAMWYADLLPYLTVTSEILNGVKKEFHNENITNNISNINSVYEDRILTYNKTILPLSLLVEACVVAEEPQLGLLFTELSFDNLLQGHNLQRPIISTQMNESIVIATNKDNLLRHNDDELLIAAIKTLGPSTLLNLNGISFTQRLSPKTLLQTNDGSHRVYNALKTAYIARRKIELKLGLISNTNNISCNGSISPHCPLPPHSFSDSGNPKCDIENNENDCDEVLTMPKRRALARDHKAVLCSIEALELLMMKQRTVMAHFKHIQPYILRCLMLLREKDVIKTVLICSASNQTATTSIFKRIDKHHDIFNTSGSTSEFMMNALDQNWLLALRQLDRPVSPNLLMPTIEQTAGLINVFIKLGCNNSAAQLAAGQCLSKDKVDGRGRSSTATSFITSQESFMKGSQCERNNRTAATAFNLETLRAQAAWQAGLWDVDLSSMSNNFGVSESVPGNSAGREGDSPIGIDHVHKNIFLSLRSLFYFSRQLGNKKSNLLDQLINYLTLARNAVSSGKSILACAMSPFNYVDSAVLAECLHVIDDQIDNQYATNTNSLGYDESCDGINHNYQNITLGSVYSNRRSTELLETLNCVLMQEQIISGMTKNKPTISCTGVNNSCFALEDTQSRLLIQRVFSALCSSSCSENEQNSFCYNRMIMGAYEITSSFFNNAHCYSNSADILSNRYYDPLLMLARARILDAVGDKRGALSFLTTEVMNTVFSACNALDVNGAENGRRRSSRKESEGMFIWAMDTLITRLVSFVETCQPQGDGDSHYYWQASQEDKSAISSFLVLVEAIRLTSLYTAQLQLLPTSDVVIDNDLRSMLARVEYFVISMDNAFLGRTTGNDVGYMSDPQSRNYDYYSCITESKNHENDSTKSLNLTQRTAKDRPPLTPALLHSINEKYIFHSLLLQEASMSFYTYAALLDTLMKDIDSKYSHQLSMLSSQLTQDLDMVKKMKEMVAAGKSMEGSESIFEQDNTAGNAKGGATGKKNNLRLLNLNTRHMDTENKNLINELRETEDNYVKYRITAVFALCKHLRFNSSSYGVKREDFFRESGRRVRGNSCNTKTLSVMMQDLQSMFKLIQLWFGESLFSNKITMTSSGTRKQPSDFFWMKHKQRNVFDDHNDDMKQDMLSQLLAIPPHKFLVVFPQLTAHLGEEPAVPLDSSLKNQISVLNSASVLERLIVTIAFYHPYHTLFQLFSIKNGDKFSSLEEKETQIVMTARIDKAKEILYRLRNAERSTPPATTQAMGQPLSGVKREPTAAPGEIAGNSRNYYMTLYDRFISTVVQETEIVTEAYLQLGFIDNNNITANTCISVKRDMLVAKEVPSCTHVVTPTIPIRTFCEYDSSFYVSLYVSHKKLRKSTSLNNNKNDDKDDNDDAIECSPYMNNPALDYIHCFESYYTICGGLSKPKRIKCFTSTGNIVTQLIKTKDDPKQDCVVEQVFGLSNVLLNSVGGRSAAGSGVKVHDFWGVDVDAIITSGHPSIAENLRGYGDDDDLREKGADWGSEGEMGASDGISCMKGIISDIVMRNVGFQGCQDTITRNAKSEYSGLYMRTYIVVPLAPTAGIVQWVPHTMTLNEYLIGESIHVENVTADKKDGPRSNKTILRSTGAHFRYFPHERSFNDCSMAFRAASSKPSKAENGMRDIEKCLLDIYNHFTPVLHYFFLENFVTAKTSLEARKRYMYSVATSSILGYIVGLGDRHLSNVLIDVSTGDLVHIDHGMAFDYGALLLKIPEVVPFRLTRDVVDGFGILGFGCDWYNDCGGGNDTAGHGSAGPFQSNCARTLGVLRKHKALLMTILRVFMLHGEPISRWALDFQKVNETFSRLDVKTPTQNEKESNEATINKGSNVADGDGEIGNANKDMKGYIRRALQRVNNRLDGIEGAEKLSVTGHVQKLIHTARDTSKLSQMFVGWAPFV